MVYYLFKMDTFEMPLVEFDSLISLVSNMYFTLLSSDFYIYL